MSYITRSIPEKEGEPSNLMVLYWWWYFVRQLTGQKRRCVRDVCSDMNRYQYERNDYDIRGLSISKEERK